MDKFEIKNEEDLYDMLGNLDKFNAFLGLFAEHITRKVLLDIPAIVLYHVQNEQSYSKIKNKFFTDNPELVNFKPIVGQFLNSIVSEHPDWTIEKVFTEAGIKAKEKIKLLLEKKNEQKLQA